MIKAIIFDCFGVLTTDGWLPFKHAHFADDENKNNEATRLNVLSNNGTLPYQAFLQQVAKLAGVSPAELDTQMHTSVANRETLELVQQLRAKGYTIAMLSNISGDWLHDFFSEAELALFDVLSLSFKTGHSKPDPIAYHTVIQQLGCSFEECVIIDDQPLFVERAVALGMHGIIFRNSKQCREELTVLLKTNTNE